MDHPDMDPTTLEQHLDPKVILPTEIAVDTLTLATFKVQSPLTPKILFTFEPFVDIMDMEGLLIHSEFTSVEEKLNDSSAFRSAIRPLTRDICAQFPILASLSGPYIFILGNTVYTTSDNFVATCINLSKESSQVEHLIPRSALKSLIVAKCIEGSIVNKIWIP